MAAAEAGRLRLDQEGPGGVAPDGGHVRSRALEARLRLAGEDRVSCAGKECASLSSFTGTLVELSLPGIRAHDPRV